MRRGEHGIDRFRQVNDELGLHSLVYTARWDEAAARDVFSRAAGLGYDLVEVLMFDPAQTDTAMTARLAEEYGVGVIAAVCGTLTADISSADVIVTIAACIEDIT